MAKKQFTQLRAHVVDSCVVISFYLSAPLFKAQQEKGESAFVRIYRREEPDFTFNEDYAEFFDGLIPHDADIIFEGDLPLLNHRKGIYHDADVKFATTYVYWIEPAKSVSASAPIGPAAVRVRDPRIWWPHTVIKQRLQKMATEYPSKVLLDSYGKTVCGRSIPGLTAGNPSRVIALIGAIHPGESGPELIIPAVEKLLRENSDLLEKTGITILPSVCIDEREKMVAGNPWYLRKNHSDVDINRNFPARWDTVEYTYGLITSDPDATTFRGATPASEPETRAVMEFIKETKPLCIFSFHCLACICGPTFLASRYAKDDADFNAKCEALITPYSTGFYEDQTQFTAPKFSCSAGGLSTWAYDEGKIPAFDLEWDGREESKISHHDETTLELLQEYQERHYCALKQLLQSLLS